MTITLDSISHDVLSTSPPTLAKRRSLLRLLNLKPGGGVQGESADASLRPKSRDDRRIRRSQLQTIYHRKVDPRLLDAIAECLLVVRMESGPSCL